MADKRAERLKSLVKEHGADVVGYLAAAVGAGLGFDANLSDFGGIPGAGAGLISGFKDLVTGSGSHAIPNPLFYLNGFDEAPSPTVDAYLRSRRYKKFGGGMFSLAGSALSSVTAGTNPLAMARHASSEVATLVHIYKLHALKQQFKSSDTVGQWIDLVVKMKIMKAASQGVQLAVNALPSSIAALGATVAAIGAGSSIATKIAAKTMGGACAAASMQLHWRAYRELTISQQARGPATLIIKELFSRRQYTVLGGSHDYKRMIMEQGGWEAIQDKLLLL